MLRTDYLRALESLCPAEEVSVIEPDLSGHLKLVDDFYVIEESGESECSRGNCLPPSMGNVLGRACNRQSVP